ncbi:hypothetical protein IMG5_100490 [Ichthyophthirius multifiliis]|uniref:Xaa-Pro aminopeptidase n=1 Tax=Ichthyophthirius multifiliis TaxID=5932 RepID=G0QSA1_ICHMU|nr:hypothetical protein IMG5_100490 [Ichthyophthirius multifiliis]EGR31899.1 hypothetical protein IMG5_100490 [Ichthyophthirius multifiliis]|eukprot:XP_004035385.1 hypothetical protein IMG5_100490 [Ichthyophthirius multifiliis]
MQNVDQKLIKIRELLKKKNIDAYLVPHDDAHNSEYIAASDERLAYISNFKGSAGFALITQEKAFLWVDSRYWLDAEKNLDQGWEMKKLGIGQVPWTQDVSVLLNKGSKIGYDPLLVSTDLIVNRQKFFEKHNIQLEAIEQNLVDEIWENKQEDNIEQIIIHELQYVGQSTGEKINLISQKVKEINAQMILTGKLDEIAWILNLRGQDIQFNPVFKSFLIINFNFNQNSYCGTLYVDQRKINKEVEYYLKENHINMSSYQKIFEDLPNFQKIAIHEGEINYKITTNLNQQEIIKMSGTGIINKLKGIKTPTQVQGFRDCNIRDGVSLVSYLAWLEHELVIKKNQNLNEYTAALVLEEKRLKNDKNKGLSFETISSVGPNAAIVHYKPCEKTAALLKPNLIYLLDSGAQYLDGTTDVTRTLHFGNASNEEKDAYTRVLLGNIDVQRVQWPSKSLIAGSDIDVLARRHLWANYMDYGHGTGHGIGHFLNVHEGPHGISKYRNEPLLEGMIVSDEPGYYKDGEFGIRIEDDLVVINKGNEFLGFENLTLCPYDRNLIDYTLLTKNDAQFVDQYHQQVWNKLSPVLKQQNDQIALDWLKKNTQPLPV